MRAKETLGLDFLPCSWKSGKGKRCGDEAEEGYRMCPKHRKQERGKKQKQRDKAKELKLLDFVDNLSATSRSVMSKDYMRHLLSSQSTLKKAKQKLGETMDTFKDQPQMASRVREVFQSTTRDRITTVTAACRRRPKRQRPQGLPKRTLWKALSKAT